MKACVWNPIDAFFSQKNSHVLMLCQIFLGSLFLVMCSKMRIPLYPVPITMQTFGVFLLAIMQGGKRAFCSTLLYLLFASLGLPVLATTASVSLWWVGPSAGYLISFPIAAFVIGKMVDSFPQPSSFQLALSILVSSSIVYFLGVLGLMRMMNFEQSLSVGLIPFLPMCVIKGIMATFFGTLWVRHVKE